ncbi:MAG: YlbF family regulator [Caldicoprobacterales bacterium]|jgi:cell fate (sporulation/competence/biofilm development) regulator YmcA (YheA/YmcA/DUF963 family)
MYSNNEVNKAIIMKMTKELGLTILKSDEVLRYRNAEKMMANDQKAYQIISKYRKLHKELVCEKHSPKSDMQKIKLLTLQLEKMDKEIKANPLVAEYYRTGNAVNFLLSQVNQILKFYCFDQEEESQFDKLQCCNGCISRCSK